MGELNERWTPRRERCFFCHIPKTAGMTIRGELASQYAVGDRMPAARATDLASLPRPLESYKLFAGHFRYVFRDALPPDTKTFTILRDPVSRTISHLKHLLTDPSFHELHALARGRDLRAIARDPRIMSQCSDIQVGYLSRPERGERDAAPARPIWDLDKIGPPQEIDTALQAIAEMDFVGFVDDLSDDFARVCERFGLHPPLELPVVNSAAERTDVGPPDTELEEIVREANALDLAFYAEARKRLRPRPPLAPRRDRVAALIRDGVYSTITLSSEFPVSGPIPGAGFWPQEVDRGRFHRWTGPGHDLVFELPLAPGNRFRFEFTAEGLSRVGALSAFVDEKPVEIPGGHTNNGRSRIVLDFEPSPGSEFTTVRFHSEKLSTASANDRRNIGFVLRGVAIHEAS